MAMTSVDVTVRGGGIMGLAAAWAMARRGARIRLIESRSIGAGASGGLVGALAPHAPEQWNPLKTFQLGSLLMAEDWWADVQRSGGKDPGYLRSGRLQPVADQAGLELAQIRNRAAAELWQGRAIWQLVAADPAASWQPASPTGMLIHDTLTARISPRAACAALLAALQAHGAEVICGEAICGEAPERGLVLHATGHEGLAALSAAFGRKLGGGQKGQAVLFGHQAGQLPQIYAAGLHVVPHGDGTVAVGSTSESEWSQPGPDHQSEALVARARALLPVLEQAPVLEHWAGIRPRAKNRGPVAGAWPDRPGQFLLNGGFKIGFGMAPALAEGMADLLLEGRQSLPPAFWPAALLA